VCVAADGRVNDVVQDRRLWIQQERRRPHSQAGAACGGVDRGGCGGDGDLGIRPETGED
jgi:hypothetical protein